MMYDIIKDSIAGYLIKEINAKEEKRLNDWFMTILEAEEHKMNIKTEQQLADLFAIIDTVAWYVADEEYDYLQGTKQHAWAMEHTDRWFDLRDDLQNEIFAILRNEGIVIPEKKQIDVLKPFMSRNGYIHTGSRWSRRDKKE